MRIPGRPVRHVLPLAAPALTACGALLAAVLAAAPVEAHGGRVVQPPPAPPPWARDPLAPGPPAPPTTPPGMPTPPPGTTPRGVPGESMPATGGPRPRARGTLPPGGWKDWWDANGDVLRLARRRAAEVTPEDPLFRVGEGGEASTADPDRARKRAVVQSVMPALLSALDPKNRRNPDTVATAWLALGKVATQIADVDRIVEAARRRDLPAQVHEAAVLALGLLRRSSPSDAFDGRTLDGVRAVLFAALDDDELPTRTRAFAGLALGFLGDQATDESNPFARGGREVVRGLWMRLLEKSAAAEVPVALVVALSLQPNGAVPSGVLAGLRALALTGRVEGHAHGQFVRAHAVLALARLVPEDSGAGVFLGLVAARGVEDDVRRSAILALSSGAPRFDGATRVDAAKRLCEASKSGDRDTTGLVLVALARLLAADFAVGSGAVLGSTPAEEVLLKAATGGAFELRPFAAIALGLAARAAPAARDLERFAAFRGTAVEVLRKSAADEGADPDSRGAFCLGLGLVEDEGAVRLLASIAGKDGALESLRANACAALGLMGRRTPDALATLRAAVATRSSDVVRREAARALGMLGDVAAVPGLVQELEAGGSDHVLARIVLALGSIGDASAIAPLSALVRDRAAADPVQAIACAGLGLLGDLESTPTLSAFASRVNYLARTDALHEVLSLL